MHTTTVPSTTLPLGEAASLLGVHPAMLREWAARGRLRSMRGQAPDELLFQVADLEAFMASGSPADDPTASATAGSHAMPVLEAQIDSIANLATRLNRLSTVSEIGSAICLELRQLIDYHNVRVYRIEGDEVVPVAWRGEVGVYVGEDGHQLRMAVGEGITGWVARHGEPQYLPDAARDPRAETIPGTEDELEESMLLAPMRYGDRTIGVIVLSKLGLDRFGPRDQECHAGASATR